MIDSTPGPLGPFAEPRPSMQGRYLIRNKRKAQAFAALDALLALVPSGKGKVPAVPERILVANWGHLGDVITTFGALALLRQSYPGARIGMIVGSWGRAAIQATGFVDDLHIVDHWGVNRANISGKAKRARYRETRTEALRNIRATRYQIAIDLYPFFPPAHPLFFRARIPVRVGFSSGGFGPLLTHALRWPDADRPIADHYQVLLNALDPARPFPPESLRPRRARETLAPLPVGLIGLSNYAVLHPGAGAPFKDWGIDKWRALIADFHRSRPELRLVLTGAGAGEVAIAEALAAEFPDLLVMAGQASFEEFVSIIAQAALVICPDTATGHVAALFDVPTVSVFTGTNSVTQWRPYSDRVQVLVQPVLCAPCNRAGCDVMACIRDVSPATVMAAITRLSLLNDTGPRC